MDRETFRARLAAIEDGDQSALADLVSARVESLSDRHRDIQQQIRENNDAREHLAGRLETLEERIIAQADASVDSDVTDIDDVEALPSDADIEFDESLIEEVNDVRQQARQNYQRTTENGADLQAELAENTEELELYGEVLAAVEHGELSTGAARDRLLDELE